MSDRPSPYNTKNNNTKNKSEFANPQLYEQGSLFDESIERTGVAQMKDESREDRN